MRPIFIYSILLGLFISCTPQIEEEINPEDRVLAQVYEKKLMFSEIAPALQAELSKEDSLQFSRAIIEDWVRDAILLREAELNLSADLNIEQMVEDYKSSLIMMNYTQKLVHERLDTVVSQEELQAFYEENKSQYVLEEPVIQCTFMKVKSENVDEKVDNLWEDELYSELSLLGEDFFEIELFDPDQWYTWKDINALMPMDLWPTSEIRKKKSLEKRRGNFNYYLNVKDFIDEKEFAPLSYIEDQILKVILHKRQTELLDQYRENLYKQYAERSQVKINIE